MSLAIAFQLPRIVVAEGGFGGVSQSQFWLIFGVRSALSRGTKGNIQKLEHVNFVATESF